MLFQKIQEYRRQGAEVHGETVLIAVRLVLKELELEHLLATNGGKLKLEKSWGYDWLQRHNLSYRRATQEKKKKILTPEIHNDYLYRIALKIKDNSIPKPLVVAVDETGLNLTPSSGTTFHAKGDLQVPVKCFADKRQITATLGASADNLKLPIQLIFAGKTKLCLPQVVLKNVHYSYSANHWQTVDTTKDYLNNVIFPFLQNRRNELGLAKDQIGLIIWDIWHSHINEEIVELCTQNFLQMVIVPPGFTGELQLMDVIGNFLVKSNYKKEFRTWMLDSLEKLIDEGNDFSSANILVGKRDIKEEIPKWIDRAWANIPSEIFQKGWVKIKIVQCWNPAFQKQAEVHRLRLASKVVDKEPSVMELSSFVVEDPESDEEDWFDWSHSTAPRNFGKAVAELVLGHQDGYQLRKRK